MTIVIPRKIRKKKHSHCKEFYHYELFEVKKYIVIYKCVETGKLESFSKNDFVTEVQPRERKQCIKHK